MLHKTTKTRPQKENFENKSSVRLLNPTKNEIGRTSKLILDKINVAIKSQLKLNQWKNTKEVIDWFVSIDEKPLYKFVQFDINNFILQSKNLCWKKL